MWKLKTLVDDAGCGLAEEYGDDTCDEEERAGEDDAGVAVHEESAQGCVGGEEEGVDRFPECEDDGGGEDDGAPDGEPVQCADGCEDGIQLSPCGPEPEEGEGKPTEGESATEGDVEGVGGEGFVTFAAEAVGEPELPEFVDGYSGALEEAEESELGGAAVPDADDKESDKETEDAEVGLQGDVRDAAHQCDEEGIVDVGLEPVGESDVPAGPEVEERGGGEGAVEVFREADAHEAGEGDDDVNVAGEVAIEEEGIEEGEFESGVELEGERECWMDLGERVLLKGVEEHGEYVDFEEAEDDALELDADDAGAERDGLEGELVAGEVVVELDGAGDESGEVESVEEVLEEVDGLLLGAFGAVDDEVQDAEEDVREAESEVGEVEEGGFREEGVFLKPDVDEYDGEEREEQGFGDAHFY